jgi:signal-transduction protein with cAMP-binding, CBS, and nucleotidyltransferase domain
MELTMFERLLQLPLFQGLTTREISDVMAHVRLNFVNYHPGDELITQGDACRELIYILNGEVTAEYRDPQGRFSFTEYLPNLKVIEPYNLFGMYQRVSRTYTFATEGVTLSIEKPVMLHHLLANDIIKINLLNIVCNRYQQTHSLLCTQPDNFITEKIVKFILSYSTAPKGKKSISIKMTTLAEMIHETRLNVSIALNQLQAQGHVQLQRGAIQIEDLQELARLSK